MKIEFILKSWKCIELESVRTTKRFYYSEDASFDGIGFRVVLEVVE